MFSLFLPLVLAVVTNAAATSSQCRNTPGSPGYPTAQQISQFNSSIGGRLVNVIPSGKFCQQRGGCSDGEWLDTIFRSNIPGAMDQYNFEQDYDSNPTSLCLRNGTTCGQGAVPVYAVNATSAAHIQAGVNFAQKYNLKIAIKASGHDYSGRSTAKGSLLLWTRWMQDITFHDDFKVGGKSQGNAVTVGSGVGLHTLYQASKLQGRTFVGGTAQNVVLGGGYLQGAGHSALAPKFGLGADQALEFQVVLADGSLVTANAVSHSDLFWALRGGGPGSWGVIISATVKTYPAFDTTFHVTTIALKSNEEAGALAQLHASHIFDWDDLRASQYFYLFSQDDQLIWAFSTYFPNTTIAAANASIAPFLDAVTAQGFNIVDITVNSSNIDDALSVPNVADQGGLNRILASRLVPAEVYRKSPEAFGEAYKTLLDFESIGLIAGHLVAGGQVSANANISSAVNPRWRDAKTHIILVSDWDDSTSVADINAIRHNNTNRNVPVLAALAGEGSGAYSNEADVLEPQFQTVFYGPNYARLTAIKKIYDPNDLFIVPTGVGSEHWSADGLCKLS